MGIKKVKIAFETFVRNANPGEGDELLKTDSDGEYINARIALDLSIFENGYLAHILECEDKSELIEAYYKPV